MRDDEAIGYAVYDLTGEPWLFEMYAGSTAPGREEPSSGEPLAPVRDLLDAEAEVVRLRTELAEAIADRELLADLLAWEGYQSTGLEVDRDSARSELRQLREQIAAVVKIHAPKRYQSGSVTHGGPPQYSETCTICGGRSYPCATVAALSSASTGTPTETEQPDEPDCAECGVGAATKNCVHGCRPPAPPAAVQPTPEPL